MERTGKTNSALPVFFFSSGPTTSAGFLYGYVFFRQKKDASIRRGYFQVKRSQNGLSSVFGMDRLICARFRLEIIGAAVSASIRWPLFKNSRTFGSRLF